ncbi:VOC family protein [Chloroflexota bacterium]
MLKRINHIEIVPSDLERILDFYTTIFGFKAQCRWKIEVSPLESLVFIELSGTLIELFLVKESVPVFAE